MIVIFLINLVLVIFILVCAFLYTRRDNLNCKNEINKQNNELSILSLFASKTSRGFIVLDKIGRIEWVNDGFTRITGHLFNDVIGKNPINLLSGHDTNKNTIKAMKTTLKKNVSIVFDLLNYKKNGEKIWVNIEIIPVLNKNGGLEKYIAFGENVTERIDEKKEIENLKKRVSNSSKLASLGELVAEIGHEINNPLTIISGNLDIMKTSATETENKIFKGQFKKVKDSIIRIKDIVDGLRTFSRTNDSDSDNLNLHKSINEIFQLIGTIYKNNSIYVVISYCGEDPFICGGQGKIHQVLMNLLNNAKDAIGVALKNDSREGKVVIETKVIGKKVQIKISDNGCGISKDNINKIFETFYTSKGADEGTGLGLSITRSIIEKMNGVIEVESKLSVGTTFIITLPIVDKNLIEVKNENTNTKDVEKTEVVKDKSKKNKKLIGKILVVDDEEDIREILVDYMINLGLACDEAHDGEMGLSMVKEKEYDMIFTDIRMPKLSGDKMLEKIIVEDLKRNTKFVVLSGGIILDYDSEEIKIVQKYSDIFIKKPFSMEEIIKILESNLDCEE